MHACMQLVVNTLVRDQRHYGMCKKLTVLSVKWLSKTVERLTAYTEYVSDKYCTISQSM